MSFQRIRHFHGHEAIGLFGYYAYTIFIVHIVFIAVIDYYFAINI